MDYEIARRVRGRSVKELTIRNIEMGGSIVGSYKSAVGAKFKSAATRLQEKFDPLNYVSMLGSPLTTAILGRLFGRKGSTIRYFNEKQRNRDIHRTNIGAGRVTRLRVGDSTADILAKMYNLMEKDRAESIKRWELESEHNQQRKEEDERRHKELLDAISKGMYAQTPEKDKSMKEKFEEKLEKLFGTILKPFKAIAEFFGKVLKYIAETFEFVVEGILKIIKFVGGIVADIIEGIGTIALKVIEFIGPILEKAFGAIAKTIETVIQWLAKHEAKLAALSAIGAIADALKGKPMQSGGTGVATPSKPSGTKGSKYSNAAKVFIGIMAANKGIQEAGDYSKFYDELVNSKGEYSGQGNFERYFNAVMNPTNMQAGEAGAFIGSAVLGVATGGTGAPLGLALGSTIGFGGSLLHELYKAHKDAKTDDEKENLLYYGPVAMNQMDTLKAKPTDERIVPLIKQYQGDVLVPLMLKEGYQLAVENEGPGNPTYDYTTMRPIFYKENKDTKEIKKASHEQILEGYLSSLLTSEAEGHKKKIIEELKDKGFDFEFFKNFGTNIVEDAKSAISNLPEFKNLNEKTSTNVKAFQQEIKSHFGKLQEFLGEEYEGQTIIKQIITNPAPPPVNYSLDEEIKVRSDDSTLRKIQYNYSIGM